MLKKVNTIKKFKPKNLKLEDYDYDGWFTKEELDGEEKLDDMPPIKSDEEVKEGKVLNILSPSKLWTGLPILLAKLKAGNNSYKPKNKIIQILHLLYRHNKITKTVYNSLIKSL